MVDQVHATPPAYTGEKISFEDYLRLYEGQHAEWIDGDVLLMSPTYDQHDDLLAFFRKLLDFYLEERPLGKVHQDPFTMKLSSIRRGREPDLLFVSRPHLARLTRTYVDGPADLVIEIVSPESVERDYKIKRDEYEIGGVPEYLIVDPLQQTVTMYRLTTAGQYQVVEAMAGVLTFVVLPGFRLNIDLLWQDPLPTGRQMLQMVEAMLSLA